MKASKEDHITLLINKMHFQILYRNFSEESRKKEEKNMKIKKIISTIFIGLALSFLTAQAEKLVILHTNDTHSQIDPDINGAGGVLQRKAVIDSIRKAEKNVLLVDAGDIVQGSLYFKFFKGDVEYPLMNMMKYDIRILGNHEFDNGIDDIAKYYKDVKGTPLSANYDFSGTVLDGIFSPYVIKKVKGKKIGFFGLNVDPASLIDIKNVGGLKFKEIIPVANATADYLKNKEHCDLVVAVTHIGAVKENEKTTDYELARASKDIDIIIGGHSHTMITPGETGKYPSIVGNAEGKPVLVAQTGKYGRFLGYIKIDLDNLKKTDARSFDYELIPITDRFTADQLDKNIIKFLEPYREAVDSVNRRVIARSLHNLPNGMKTGGLANLTADIAYDYGRHKADSLHKADGNFPQLDFALMNVGGIRKDMPQGDITEGQILDTYPFSNHLVIAEISGKDLLDALGIAARKGGESVSSQILVVMDPDKNLQKVLLNGYEIDPQGKYVYATIDYLLGGNDDLVPLANSRLLWRDDEEISAPILNYIERMGTAGIPVNPDSRERFIICEPF